MAITFTSADLEALKAALLTGASTVTIGDRTITYRSQEEILRTIKIIESYLNAAPTTSPNVIPVTLTKGKV